MDLEKLREACPDLQGPYSRNAVSKALAGSAIKSGVYVIVPHDWIWIYIGSSSSITRRFSQHLYLLNNQKHDKFEMQRDHMDEVEFLYFYQVCDDREKAYALEQKIIELFANHPGLLNVSTDAKLPWVRSKDYVHPLIGTRRDECVKQKLSESTKKQFSEGRPPPFLGRKHTPESCQKLSDVAKGRVVSDGTRIKLSEKRQLGKHPRAKGVIIDGVEYDCVKSASITLKIPYGTVYFRVSSDSALYRGWSFKRPKLKER